LSEDNKTCRSRLCIGVVPFVGCLKAGPGCVSSIDHIHDPASIPAEGAGVRRGGHVMHPLLVDEILAVAITGLWLAHM
jgi:hypothetical protein